VTDPKTGRKHKSPRFHDLRHTAISRLVAESKDHARVQLIAGHASITTTMRYIHLDPKQMDDVIAAMDAYHLRSESASETTSKSVRREKSGL
jgi:integrase